MNDFNLQKAKQNLKMNSKWKTRFLRHFQLGIFILNPFEIKEIVENILAIKY